MTTAKNLVNELFVNSGRPEQGDNRSYFVKALNKVLSDGFIKVQIQQKGRIWTNNNFVDANGNLRKFNIEIKGYGWTKRVYSDNFDASDLLKYVGQFIQIPAVAEKHKTTITGTGFECVECSRCNGKGIIPAFNYYCQGICFDCYGSKYQVRRLTITV
jgi:hypothetical protein